MEPGRKDTPSIMSWREKKLEYENRMARARGKKLDTLKTCTICGADKAKACQGCGTTAYCSTDCQRIDWRDRGHRKVCKKIQAAEAARTEAPTPPPSPPREVFYGPAPRSQADEIRARIAAEHEAARARREANPEAESTYGRLGSRCPICLEEWDGNETAKFMSCCCRKVCNSCGDRLHNKPCPLCRSAHPNNQSEVLANIRRHVDNEVPEAITHLGTMYRTGVVVVKSGKKAAKLYKRAVELGDVEAMNWLGSLYSKGNGVKLDKKKAAQLWRMAADHGHVWARFNLGNLIESKDGAPGEYVEHYKIAAAHGLSHAQFRLGCCYNEGKGVAKDFDEARRLWASAAANGNEKATAVLDTLRMFPDEAARRAYHERAGSD